MGLLVDPKNDDEDVSHLKLFRPQPLSVKLSVKSRKSRKVNDKEKPSKDVEEEPEKDDEEELEKDDEEESDNDENVDGLRSDESSGDDPSSSDSE